MYNIIFLQFNLLFILLTIITTDEVLERDKAHVEPRTNQEMQERNTFHSC